MAAKIHYQVREAGIRNQNDATIGIFSSKHAALVALQEHLDYSRADE